jgi:RimJ/RimL family protein N-acetyltransferase
VIRLVDVYKDREKAMRFLYELIQERMAEPEVNISATMPTWQQHRQFVCRHPYRYWYLLDVEGEWVGYVSATDRNEIGIVLKKAHRGKGYGPQAVKALTAMHKPLPAVPSVRQGKWLANINPKNERSIKMFSGLGFKHLQNTYELA